jgi:hypothetical protein
MSDDVIKRFPSVAPFNGIAGKRDEQQRNLIEVKS